MQENNVLLDVRNLYVWYPIRRFLFISGYVKAVENVTFSVNRGETLALVGESGSGKTTIGKVVLGLLKPTRGSVKFDGIDVYSLRGKELKRFRGSIGYIQQDPYGAVPPFMTIKRILEEPMIIHGIPKEERSERVYRALEEVRLTPVEDFLNKYPHQLSGGQLQRVVIARALILRPKLIVADEPVSMLDASVRVEILTLLSEIQKSHKLSVIHITHDLAIAKYFSDRIAIMYAGQLVERGSTRDILKNPLHPYTQSLIKAVPEPDPRNRTIFKEVLPGEPPSLINPPPGCRFHPRCPFAMDICRREEPPEIEIDKGRYVKCWLYAKR